MATNSAPPPRKPPACNPRPDKEAALRAPKAETPHRRRFPAPAIFVEEKAKAEIERLRFEQVAAPFCDTGRAGPRPTRHSAGRAATTAGGAVSGGPGAATTAHKIYQQPRRQK